MARRAIAVTLLGAVLGGGCDADIGGCRDDSGCEPGQACVAGTCVAQRQDDLGTIEDLGPRPDLTQPGPPDGFSPDAFTAGCPFNGDGVIQRAELPAMPGVGAFFHANAAGETSTVDLTKENGAWDFTAVGPTDEKVYDGLLSPVGAWWATSFPDASYAQLLDAQNDYLGVYKIDDTGLYLLGLVSRTDGFYATKVSYAAPIKLVAFPLSMNDQWTSSSALSGIASGLGFYATETWIAHVDDSGTARTPFADFPVLRLRVDYEQIWGFAVKRRVIYLFLTECYGTVVRVRSLDGETGADFTEASEYRRLAAP